MSWLGKRVTRNKMHWLTAALFMAAGVYMFVSEVPATGAFFLIAGLCWPVIMKFAEPEQKP
ncbi:MAG TPA: hypothetical protein DEA26_06425 [Oceanospirillales bacterium]|nr:hypothetical protein [Oceanospirillaceae bacterium]HBS42296.1 hypothetical protein [Oceanospirillales bacterium]|tara:strand:+ start:2130 stop:2312 length:183 start_codon:yes stop_codon:yes gene_type:complete